MSAGPATILPTTKRSQANVLAFALSAGAVVLLLFDAGDADIFGLVVPIWLVASATLVVGRTVAEIR